MKFDFPDIEEKLVKETSYRSKVDEKDPFHEKDDKEWFEMEFTRIQNDLGKLFGNLLEAGDGLEVKDLGGTTEQQKSFLKDTLNQIMLKELLNKWYGEGENLESYYILLRNQLYNFRIKPAKQQQYPREDAHFWGDNYDIRPVHDEYLKQTPNVES